MRDNPFEEIERMFERMSEQFEEAQPGRMMTGTVLVDVEDRDDEFVVTADLPGFDREEIELELRDDTLELSASRETTEETESGTFVRRERRRSDVSRSVYLPEPVVAEETTAVHENGVLTVTLPKVTTEGSGGTDIPVS
ncbi:Hsp20/alpha crystallin family protein [Salinirubellus sp. GCM10025818]|jgi:HSP20 family protein|uniref:Hsp20/alpha crystallin family protein n=1 Tax=Salinirubellus TaxID=2162630 RepID=UPI0030D16806